MSVSRWTLIPLLTAALALAGPTEPIPSTEPGSSVSSAVLTGRVTDAGTGAPITEAQISVDGRTGTLTGVDGRYRISLDDLLLGQELTITVRRIGFEPATRTLVLTDVVQTADFALTATTLRLEELSVSGEPALAAASEIRGMRGDIAVAPTTFGPAQTLPGRYNPNFHTESYALIEENEFRAVRSVPLSTFSIDVDRASYSNVRRFVRDGVRPPIDAVRIEELINYFPYADPEPVDGHPLRISTEVAPAPWQPLHHLVRIGLKARSIDLEHAPANNLVFLLDVSGSMSSPDKLPLLKTAFRMLVEELRPQDRVAIVVYAGAAGLVLPSTPGSEKGVILDAIESLEAGGSTAGGAGIRLAYAVAREHFIEEGNNRVILATDGDFNVGASSDAEMVRLIEEKRRSGTFLTVLGFGTTT
jgi:Ca-activated chloride channel homolog